MNKTTFAQTVVFAAGVAVVGASIANSIKTHRTERARREQIEADLQLDLAAIKNAGEVVRERMANGGFRPLHEIEADFQNEMEFQKIIIREK